MNDYDIQRKEFMKYNELHPMVQRGRNHIKDASEYVVIQDDNDRVEEIIEVQIVSNKNNEEEDEEGKEGEEREEEEMSLLKRAKKAAVAVSGGVMVVVGIPLIPLPAPCGCIMVAGGLSVLATEFPAAQRILDQGKEKLRDFAEHEEEGKVVMKKDDIGLGFEMISNNDDNDETQTKIQSIENSFDGDTIVHKNTTRNGAKESLRQLTKHTILPLIDRLSSPKRNKEVNDDIVIIEVEDEKDAKAKKTFDTKFMIA